MTDPCAPIRIARTNDISLFTLTSSRAPTTNLEWLKNEFRSRPARWDDPDTDVTITGTLSEQRYAEYFAIPGCNLVGGATVQLKIFETDVSTTDLLNMEPLTITGPIPLGEWRAGIDPYGAISPTPRYGLLTFWFGEFIQYQRFELVITTPTDYSNEADDIRIRALHIGETLKLEKNFTFGASITYLDEPELRRTTSGSVLEARTQRESRKFTLSLNHATDNDRYLMAKFERTKLGQPFIFSAHPGAGSGWQFTDYTYLARFGNALGYSHTHSNRHAINRVTLLEV